MMKKIVVTVVVIVAIIGIAFAAYSNSNSKNPTTTNTNNTTSGTSNVNVINTTPTNTSTATTNNTQSNISPTEAQKLATKYIETSGVTAGTPKLISQGNTQVYVVPLIDENGSTVGEIDINAKNGKNLGGAGGAPVQ
jgi:hypothetical protein